MVLTSGAGIPSRRGASVYPISVLAPLQSTNGELEGYCKVQGFCLQQAGLAAEVDQVTVFR
jgi:hypothetical protein